MKNLLATTTMLALVCHAFAFTDSAEIYFKKGMEEKNAHRFLLANQAFEKAISFNASYTEAYVQNAYTALEMRQPSAAIQNFEKVLALQPQNKEAIKELTTLYYNYRRYDKAIALANQCTGCENAQRVLGMCYYQQEDYAKAIKYLEDYLQNHLQDAEVLYSIGRSYIDMEQYKKAVSYYEKAVQADPSKAGWLNELGLLYYNTNNYKNATIAFNKALEAGYNPSNDFKENLAFSYIYAGEFEKGEILVKEVFSKKPGNTTLLRDAAQAFYNVKQYDRCLLFCQRLMEVNDKDAKALYQAGMCFQKKGQNEKGEKMCDKAIEMDPSLSNLRQKQEMPGF
ncbi:MAG TPA: tetratricopeptide repeat protein [Ferruginibacter sp.]|nr:tetratricopeptide repeat protein [Niastella sp.]HRB31030.1 tetratricopeptide repeat protein [Ferruginibacter sp.]